MAEFANYDSTLVIAFVALIVSIIALVYTIKTFVLKSGDKYRCDVITTTSRESSDLFISLAQLREIDAGESYGIGITIRDGLANGAGIQARGAGIYSEGIMSMSNVIIRSCNGSGNGTHIYKIGNGAQIILRNCQIEKQ